MILITNRNLDENASPLQRFGPNFNAKGPNELRLAEVGKSGKQWKIDIFDDEIDGKFASEKVFLDLQERMRVKKRNCLFFVHGFNNNLKAVLERGLELEKRYNLEVAMFSWPANGGGAVGVLGYKSDKRDSSLSVGALDRCLEKIAVYMEIHRESACKQRFTLMCHSMGNYLLKKLMNSSVYNGETLLFDNVVLVAADANNRDHEKWVDRIAHRRRIYVAINENDSALLASRLKFGGKQKARLGHYTKNLNSQIADYLDFTNGKSVESAHAYFEGRPANKNTLVWKTFNTIFNGDKCEHFLPYDINSRTFRVR